MGRRKKRRILTKSFLLCLLCFILIVGSGELLQLLAEEGLIPTPEELYGDLGEGEKVVEENREPVVYFCQEEGEDCEARFYEVFSEVEELKCAFYDLDLVGLVDFLNAKNAQVVIDNHYDDELTQQLVDKKFDTSSQYSHNKFCVGDGEIVWTGSTNPTNNGFTKNDNNVVVVYSTYLAQNYLAEFSELWEGKYGKGNEVEYGTVVLNGWNVKNCFCPEDSCQKNVVDVLRGAEESIYFMTFSFTDKEISDVLVEKSTLGGIDVRGVFEKKRKNMQYEQFKKLIGSDVLVRGDGNRYTMHHKVFIVDNETVVFGSYNPTKSGNTRNDENVIITDYPVLVSEFLEEFDRVWEMGEEVEE